MSKSALLIANPTAKRGAAFVDRVLAKLTRRYEELGWTVLAHRTERDGPRERQIVAAHADRTDAIVAVGGDGTVRETVLGMSEAQRARTSIGFVPAGNANVLAREVGIPVDDEDRAIAIATDEHVRAMDVGTLDGTPTFLLMLDVGYFAEVVHAVANARSRPATRWLYTALGDVFYTAIGLLRFGNLRRAQVTVRTDAGEPFVATSLAIANARTYAKTGSFCPDADPGDGVLDFHAASRGGTVGYAFGAMRGATGRGRIGRSTCFTLTANDKPFVCQVDGDPVPGTHRTLEVGIVPGFYRLHVPTR